MAQRLLVKVGPMLHFSEMPRTSLLHSSGCMSPPSKYHGTARRVGRGREIKTLYGSVMPTPPPKENTIGLHCIFF